MVSLEATLTVLARIRVSSEGSTGELLASRLTYMVVGYIQFLEVCWPKATLSSLPHGLLQHGHLFHLREREPTSK